MPASKSKPASQHRVYDQVEDQGHKPNELGDRKNVQDRLRLMRKGGSASPKTMPKEIAEGAV
jgi:hypothetical protein